MKQIGNNYFSSLLKKYSVFTVLFVTMLFITATYAIDKYNLLTGNATVRNIILLSTVVLAAVYGFFFIKKINTKGITFGDAFIWGLFLFLIAYAVYLFVTDITLWKLIPLIIIEPFTIFFVFYRLFYFDKAEKAEYKTYFKTVFKKYTFYIPIILALLFVALFYVADKANLIDELIKLFNTDLRFKTICIITVISFALFVFTAAAKRTVNAVDFFIYFGIIVSIVMIAYSFIFSFDKQKLIVSGAFLILSAIFLFIRMQTFNLKVHRAIFLNIINGSYEINLLTYLKKLFRRYDFFFALFIASFFSIITYTIFNFNLFNDISSYKGFTAITAYSVYGVIGLSVLAGMFIILKSFPSIHINVSDFIIFAGFLTAILCFVTILLTANIDTITLIVFAGQILITQILLVSRSTEVFVFNGR